MPWFGSRGRHGGAAAAATGFVGCNAIHCNEGETHECAIVSRAFYSTTKQSTNYYESAQTKRKRSSRVTEAWSAANAKYAMWRVIRARQPTA